MSNVRYELFGDGAALVSSDLSGGNLKLLFPKGTDGFIRIGARIYKLFSSETEVPLSELEDGKHTPHLFTSFGEYILPGVEKSGKTLTVSHPTSEELRLSELSVKRLALTVASLEKQLSELRDMIRTSTLF